MSSTMSPQPANAPKSRRRMINPLLWLPLLAIMLIAGTLSLYLRDYVQAAPAVSLVQIPGSVPGIVAHSKLVGPADTNQTISLAVSLNLRNQAALNTYLSEVTQPKSTIFHRYLSQAAFIGAFSPTQAQYDAVRNYLQQAGFTVTQTYNHRLLLDATGTVGLAERVFRVQINNYTAPGGRTFYSNTADPVMPSTISSYVQGVVGLDSANILHRMSTLSQGNAQHNTTPAISKQAAATCTPSNFSYYTPSQIASAYNLNGFYNANGGGSKGYNGEGQTIALYELAQYQQSDITNYENCYGHSHTPIYKLTIDGGPPSPGNNDGGGAIEVELDAELILSAAPHLGQLRIYEAPNSPGSAGPMDEWSHIVADNPAIVSTSWGDCEINSTQAQVQAEAALFKEAAAQGQTIFAASGDSGSAGCYTPPTDTNTALSVDDPASQPFVTAVGGTNLTMNGNSYGNEVTWNVSPSKNDQGGASGGGISERWQMPSWQTGPGVINQYSSGSPCGVSPNYCREVPDVSLHSSEQTWYLFYCTVVNDCPSGSGSTYPWFGVAGTSCGAPLWAAITALTNEESVKNDGFNMGFLNPLLYQVASNSTKYSNDFHDVIGGNNDWQNFNSGHYPATANYDMATGLGSPDAYNLAQDLIALNGQRAPTPANSQWYFAEGAVGGDFAEYLTLQNPSATQDASVTVTYELQNHNPATIQQVYKVPHSTRQTVYVNGPTGVNIAPNGPKVSLAAIVTSDVPIVAERPMYFSFHGVKSGTDVMGATSAHTTYYFPYGNTAQSGSTHDSTYITMLNPSTSATAHVTLTYYTNSCGASGQPACPTETLPLLPQARGTASPSDAGVGLAEPVSIAVNSDQPIVAERPMYVNASVPNAGPTTGAASEVGATSPGTDWLFAEGSTRQYFQEYLNLANFGTTAATATIHLEYTDGEVQTVTQSVPAAGFVQFDVNAHPGTCNPSPCSASVSAEVTSDQPIVVDRLMYFHLSGISGITEAVGTPAAQSIYAFAEGYTGGKFTEYLTVQNPTNNVETVAVTLFTQKGLVFEVQISVAAHSRGGFTINNVLNPMGPDSVSMVAQVLGNGKIVAERPEYFSYGISGTGLTATGASDVIGYTGE